LVLRGYTPHGGNTLKEHTLALEADLNITKTTT
jgi:hypothetical protein